MCIYISSEIILANLLSYKPNASTNGVSFTDIENYCKCIKKSLIDTGISKNNYILFNINRNQLNFSLQIYSKEFRKFQNKYYIKYSLNMNILNSKITPELSRIMKNVAESF